MTTLHERIETPLALQDTFDFIADFSNSARWDPGVATATRLDDRPLGMGSRFDLGVRMAGRVSQMEYVITTWQPPQRVVLTGSGSGVAAIDDIRFEASEAGTVVDYIADIRLRGALRLVAPLAGGAFARIARDARDGMQRALDERAKAG
jgi:carbon monoxide dehydrogenase subunit G